MGRNGDPKYNYACIFMHIFYKIFAPKITRQKQRQSSDNQQKNTAKVNVLRSREREMHYTLLWYNPLVGDEIVRKCGEHCVYFITLEELEEALKDTKNRKATALNGINS